MELTGQQREKRIHSSSTWSSNKDGIIEIKDDENEANVTRLKSPKHKRGWSDTDLDDARHHRPPLDGPSTHLPPNTAGFIDLRADVDSQEGVQNLPLSPKSYAPVKSSMDEPGGSSKLEQIQEVEQRNTRQHSTAAPTSEEPLVGIAAPPAKVVGLEKAHVCLSHLAQGCQKAR